MILFYHLYYKPIMSDGLTRSDGGKRSRVIRPAEIPNISDSLFQTTQAAEVPNISDCLLQTTHQSKFKSHAFHKSYDM